MRILHHSNQLGMGGTEKCMQYLLEYLRSRGHECWCVHGTPPSDLAGRLREPLLKKILGPDRVLSYSSQDDFFRHVGDVKPEIFHAHRSGRPEFPLVPGLKEHAGYIVETNVFGGRDPSPFIDMTLYVSPMLLKRGRGIMRRKHVLYNPVKEPLHGRDLRGELGIGAGTFVIGRVGRPDDRIFDPISLHALKVLETEGLREILFLVLAPPPRMVSLAGELGLKNIRFLNAPMIGDEEMSGFYNTIDLLAHARRDGETFGLNIAEAMAHGKPVVSHRSRFANAHADFVRVCGFMAAEDDYIGYAGFVRRLYSDRVLARKLGAAGKDFAAKHFLIENVGRALESYYRELPEEVPFWRRLGWLL